MPSNLRSPFDKILSDLQAASSGARNLPVTSTAQPLGTVMNCPVCGELIELRQTKAVWKGRPMRFWSDCSCIDRGIKKYEEQRDAAGAYQAEQRSEGGPARSDLRSVKHMTFATFDTSRYPAAGNPAAEARAWLAEALPEPYADYHRGAPACLYFYSAGKGRGKTHLAAAVASEAHAAGKVTFFADEIGYIERYWSLGLEAKAELSKTAGVSAWLTVVDDLGQRERATDTLRDAWYAVFNPRWLKRGWTVVTSNYTPDELLRRGTINDATYSRLVQMCGGQLVAFDGGDYRMESVQ